MKDNLVGGIGTEIVNLRLEDALEILWTIDVKVLGTSKESEGGEHADESKGMVTVQMGEEDGLQTGESEVRTA